MGSDYWRNLAEEVAIETNLKLVCVLVSFFLFLSARFFQLLSVGFIRFVHVDVWAQLIIKPKPATRNTLGAQLSQYIWELSSGWNVFNPVSMVTKRILDWENCVSVMLLPAWKRVTHERAKLKVQA